MLFSFGNISSPFDTTNKSENLFSGLLGDFEHFTQYLVWTFIFLFAAMFLFFVGKAVYGIIAKNGEVQKNAISSAMVSMMLLIFVRLGLPLVFGIAEYGFNQFLIDMVHLFSDGLIFIGLGTVALTISFFFLYKLINHSGVRRRSLQFLVASVLLFGISYIVPIIFLDI